MTKQKHNGSLGQKLLSDSKFYMGYSRWVPEKGAYETWNESVERVMEMHRNKFAHLMTPTLASYLVKAESAYKQQLVLGAQRALQFGGSQLRKHEARMYNCSTSHCNRPEFFQEAMYLLLCGCGVGFSVQSHHVAQLPALTPRDVSRAKVFKVPDSIEGWADAFGVLLSSFFENGGTYPEYQGCTVHFDLSEIRPKDSLISGGFKAPGPEPLRRALNRCEELLTRALGEQPSVKMRPIVAYDFVMFMSDAVLAGGVRRSATICMFDKTDREMLLAKTGDWFTTNPQRSRSNNSVVLVRNELNREEWADIMQSVREFGEPGFIFTDNTEFVFNPCVEIGMLPVTEDGVSGFQFCNLVETNGGRCTSPEIFYKACEAGAVLATLQAGYTNFKYLSDATRRITERESLIGVSITGWMNNPEVLFNEAVLKKGAQIVKDTNRIVAELLGINPAARTTCAKPSGNASVLLGTASGCHGEHSPLYFRNVQMGATDPIAQLIQEFNPNMVEASVWNETGSDVVVSFPVVAKEGSIYKKDLLGVKQLQYVKMAQQFWVEPGTNVELCTNPQLRNNISNTITVDDWDEIEEYLFNNRRWFAGVSLMAASGDKAFAQAPFTEVHTAEEIVKMYGDAALFASGLIVDGLHAFNNDLWKACATAAGYGLKLTDQSADLLKRDWVRRFKKFAINFFENNEDKASACLKDCHNLHKWVGINRRLKPLNFAEALTAQQLISVDTMGSQACAGGVCEMQF